MKKNIKEIFQLMYCLGTFLSIFILWNNWELICHEYFSLFIPKFIVFVVPLILAFSSILLLVIGWKNIGRVFGVLGLLPIEYMLYMKNFIHVDGCPCSRFYPFLDTEIHFWINTIMILFFLISSVNHIVPDNNKLNKTVEEFNLIE